MSQKRIDWRLFPEQSKKANIVFYIVAPILIVVEWVTVLDLMGCHFF